MTFYIRTIPPVRCVYICITQGVEMVHGCLKNPEYRISSWHAWCQIGLFRACVVAAIASSHACGCCSAFTCEAPAAVKGDMLRTCLGGPSHIDSNYLYGWPRAFRAVPFELVWLLVGAQSQASRRRFSLRTTRSPDCEHHDGDPTPAVGPRGGKPRNPPSTPTDQF
jgi:hypothetical protein